MKRTTVAWMLKAVLLVCACGALLAAGYLLPNYLGHVREVRPELTGWYGWGMAFGWLLTVPALLALALLWRVLDTLAAGEPFCADNARRFRQTARLAALDLALVAALGMILWINHISPPFLTMTVLGLMFLGVAAGLACFALSGLFSGAARLREENEMTV